MLVETLVDAVFGIAILVFALTQHVPPRVPELPSIPAFEWSSAAANPTVTAIIAVFVALAAMLAMRRIKARERGLRRARAAGLHDPPRAAPLPAARGVAPGHRLGLQVASADVLPRGLRHPGTVRNAVLVMVVGSLTTLLPVTPGGVGTQQALIVVVLGGGRSDGQLLSFSVGMQAAVAIANALIGGSPSCSCCPRSRSLGDRPRAPHSARRQHVALEPSTERRRAAVGRVAHAGIARQPELAERALGAATDGDDRARPQPLDQRAQHLGPRTQLADRRRAVRERLPGRCGCAGTTFQSTVSASSSSAAAHRGRSCPTARPSPPADARGRVGRAPGRSVRSAVKAMPVKRRPRTPSPRRRSSGARRARPGTPRR